jgi:N-acetylneuraminate synthase/N,N'-diacetyllegionaminate synthase
MMFHFGKRAIGPGQPCFIIAEAGVNHDGSLATARWLIEAAHQAGADAVKFQTFRTELLVSRRAAMADYQKANTKTDTDQFTFLKRLELDEAAFRELQQHANAVGVPFFSTPDEEMSADFLAQLNVPALKIGSGELTNQPFLRHIARLGLPVILSTGMGTWAETVTALETLQQHGAPEIALLHCVSAYPAPFAALNLRVIPRLQETLGVPVGFSDHTMGSTAAIAATALGACIIEKHLTLDTALSGPDHACSLNPDQFAAMVQAIRDTEQALGTGVKSPAAAELNTRAMVRKSVVALQALSPGTRLTAAHLGIKRTDRPGIPPADRDNLIGLTLQAPVEADEPLTWQHFKT